MGFVCDILLFPPVNFLSLLQKATELELERELDW